MIAKWMKLSPRAAVKAYDSVRDTSPKSACPPRSSESLHRDAQLDGELEGRCSGRIDLRFFTGWGSGQGDGAEKIALVIIGVWHWYFFRAD